MTDFLQSGLRAKIMPEKTKIGSVYTDPLGLKGLAEYIYDIHVFFQEQWDYHSGQAGKKLHSGSLPGYLYHGSSALVSGVLALAVPENDDEMFLAVITFDMAPALAEGAVYLGKKIVFFRKCGNTLKKVEPPEIPPGLMDEAARLEKQWAKQIRELLDSGEIVAVDASKSTELAKVPAFANKQRAFEHYAKHVKGVILKGGKTKLNPRSIDLPEFSSFDEYMTGARKFHSSPIGKGVLEGVRANGDFIRFDTNTGYFGVRTQDGVIRTMFCPDGSIAKGFIYFQDQF